MHSNPFANPLFLPTLRNIGLLFIFGLGLVLFFARKDLRAGLTGELGQRYLGWLMLTPLFLLAAFVGGLLGAAILLFFFYRVVFEYVRAVGVERQYTFYLCVLVLLTFVIATFVPALYFMLPAASILLLTLVPILTGKLENLYLQLSFAGRGYLYLVWSIGHVILLRQLGGVGMVVLVGVAVALSDVMQYTVGKLLGRHIISPAVNPRKAWEGLLGDFIGAGIGVALFSFALPPEFELFHRASLTFLIGLGAAWGDLASSLVKRVAGVKDWGQILPGHGGLLDRANSMVIAIPLAYYYTYLVLVY
ncbi:MAG TPA: phosphatidate cytidylyltransferase [Ardenticatenaceae bacterium]|jgi:phosphatidate cytidylyltransferase